MWNKIQYALIYSWVKVHALLPMWALYILSDILYVLVPRLKLASLRQQTLRALTTVSALNAHQLRPDIEPDGSLRMADTDTYITDGIGHPKRKQSFL